MPKYRKAAGASGTDKEVCSANFCRLLSELRAEHECEVGRLAAELDRLRSPVQGSSAADNYDDFTAAVVPCMPLPCMPRSRLLGGQGRGAQQAALRDPCLLANAVVPAPDGAPSVPSSPRAPSSPPSGLGAAEEQEEPQGTAGNAAIWDPHSKKSGVSEASQGESQLWPVWLSFEGSEAGSIKTTWLQEAVKSHITAKQSKTRRNSGQIQFGRMKGHFPLFPTSKIKIAWDLVAPFALLFDFVMIPLQVFDFPEAAVFRILEGLLLFYWISDMLISFNSAYFDNRGEVVTSYRKIAAKYMRTWFVPDILITGFDIITTIVRWAIIAPDGAAAQNADLARWGKFLRVCRVIRILRLGRMAKLQEIIYGIQVYFDSEAVAIMWGLCWNIFTLLVLNHLTACLWYWIGTLDQEFTWLNSPIRGARTYADIPKGEAYFVSLHWSLTLFTPASMSVQPENLLERIYAVVCLILAMVFFASFVSTATAGMTRLRTLKSEGLEQSFKLRKFMRENQISLDLVARVIRYVDIAMQSYKKRIPMEDVARLKWLSSPLYMELKLELSAPTLGRHRFFQKYAACSLAATRHLCFAAVTTQRVSRQDTLFSVFGEAFNMYFIRSGHMVYKRAKGLNNFERKVHLQRGDWFVEPVLWIRWVHHGSMKAFTESELMALEAKKFREVSTSHPDVLAIATAYAAAYALRCRENHVCDVPQEVFDRQSWFGHNGVGLDIADGCTSEDSESELGFEVEYSSSKGSKGTSGCHPGWRQ